MQIYIARTLQNKEAQKRKKNIQTIYYKILFFLIVLMRCIFKH